MLREARGPASRFSDEIGSVIASLGAEAHRCVGEFGRLRQLVADIRASLSLTVTGLNLPDKEGPG